MLQTYCALFCHVGKQSGFHFTSINSDFTLSSTVLLLLKESALPCLLFGGTPYFLFPGWGFCLQSLLNSLHRTWLSSKIKFWVQDFHLALANPVLNHFCNLKLIIKLCSFIWFNSSFNQPVFMKLILFYHRPWVCSGNIEVIYSINGSHRQSSHSRNSCSSVQTRARVPGL